MRNVKLLILMVLGGLITVSPAWADFTSPTFTTLAGTQSGTASFSFNSTTGVLSITLTNTSDVTATGDVLTGVGWSFTGTGSGLSLSSPVGTPTGVAGYNCTGSGASTVCTANSSITSVAWKADVGTGSVGSYAFNITSFTGTPKGTAIANDSILTDGHDGLSGDQPYFKGPVTFTTTVSGTNLAGITGVSGVFIAFGTAGDGLTTNSPPAVPEPSAYLLMLAGLGVMGFAARRRIRNN